jgi:exportin-T
MMGGGRQVVPSSKVLRGRVISFLHRLVECLGDRLLPFLPAALAALLPVTADATDVSDVHALLSQLAMRYKAALQPLLAKVAYLPSV